jgi:hypothetical protein
VTHFIDAVHSTKKRHKHGTELAWKIDKCRCSKCTSAHHAWLKEQRKVEADPDDPRVCEHCPGEVRFPTKKAKHEHVAEAHPITRTPVTNDKTPNVFDLPTLDMKGW